MQRVPSSTVVACAWAAMVVACGPSVTPSQPSADSGTGPSSTSTDPGTSDIGEGSTVALDDSSGDVELVPCFVPLSNLSAISVDPMHLDDDGLVDLATRDASIGLGNTVNLQLNEGDAWTLVGTLEGDEFARVVPFDEDLDGLSDLAFYDPPNDPVLLRNIGQKFGPAEPLDEPWIDALFVDLDGVAPDDVVQLIDEFQVDTYLRNPDGSLAPPVSTLVDPPDAGPDATCDPWTFLAGTPSVNTAHFTRRYFRCCGDDRCDYVTQVLDGSQGMPTAVTTYADPADRWLGDLEGDGIVELIAINGVVESVVDGELVERMDLESREWAVGDLEPDGLLDLVVNVEPGDGRDIQPRSTVLFGADDWAIPYDVEGRRPGPIADYDGDGDGDLLLQGWIVGSPTIYAYSRCPV